MSTTLAAAGARRVVTSGSVRQHAQELLAQLEGDPGRLLVDGDLRTTALPSDLGQVIADVVAVIARGGTITIGALPEELSTTVAAEQLGVSRPTLMKMIREGRLDAHKVGSHHRIKAADVLAAKRARLERQRAAFDELRDLEEQLDARG